LPSHFYAGFTGQSAWVQYEMDKAVYALHGKSQDGMEQHEQFIHGYLRLFLNSLRHFASNEMGTHT
jgi:hypothetical protein